MDKKHNGSAEILDIHTEKNMCDMAKHERRCDHQWGVVNSGNALCAAIFRTKKDADSYRRIHASAYSVVRVMIRPLYSDRYIDLQFEADKARLEMLQEIDEALMPSGYWQGGRLETVKWLVAELHKNAKRGLPHYTDSELETWHYRQHNPNFPSNRLCNELPESYIPGVGTIRECLDCACLVAGGPTRCKRCAEDPALHNDLDSSCGD